MLTAENTLHHEPISLAQQRFSACTDVLTEIYQPDINMTVWQRVLDKDVSNAVASVISSGLLLNITQEVAVERALAQLTTITASNSSLEPLWVDIAKIIDMFGCLFDAECVGMRLRFLNSAMCPNFHYDRVPCRLVTTYSGSGTQWLPNNAVELCKDGRLYNVDEMAANTIEHGHIALLKGTNWPHNERTPLVHRSPPASATQPRLLLTLDAM